MGSNPSIWKQLLTMNFEIDDHALIYVEIGQTACERKAMQIAWRADNQIGVKPARIKMISSKRNSHC